MSEALTMPGVRTHRIDTVDSPSDRQILNPPAPDLLVCRFTHLWL